MRTGANLIITGKMMVREMGEVADMTTSLREAVGFEIERVKFTSRVFGL